MPFISRPFVRVGVPRDVDVFLLVDDENNPLIWDESNDAGGILLD